MTDRKEDDEPDDEKNWGNSLFESAPLSCDYNQRKGSQLRRDYLAWKALHPRDVYLGKYFASKSKYKNQKDPDDPIMIVAGYDPD